MPFSEQGPIDPCTMCGGQANIRRKQGSIGTVVDCAQCGDYSIDFETARDKGLPIADEIKKALARYLIRQMNGALTPSTQWDPPTRPTISREFFDALATRDLPSPTEVTDNALRYLAILTGGRPGKGVDIDFMSPYLAPTIGGLDTKDIRWAFGNLITLGWFESPMASADRIKGLVTGAGWERISSLRQAHSSSRYAFFARQFDNRDLDAVFDKCLLGAVRDTGFELRTVTQRAGLVDAVIEDEIRRSRFVIADLSDHNAGAYWEAGFAEGLGKPVIYICKAKCGTTINTHFDANHRHTVLWDLSSLGQTAIQLKAVIRNTLLGEAKQSDT